jgi:hypothetical protein
MRNGPSEMVNLANSIRQKPNKLMNSLSNEDKESEEEEERPYSIYGDEL